MLVLYSLFDDSATQANPTAIQDDRLSSGWRKLSFHKMHLILAIFTRCRRDLACFERLAIADPR